MSKPVISIRGLSKMYHIAAARKSKQTLQERVVESATRPFKRIGGLLTGNRTAAADLDQEFWALNDVSFDVGPGEVVGLIGRNGAGKSTLLKLLSRITEPTRGTATIHGRVGSLLEVGTGFHPELSGRENVYLNGSILGMRRAEVDRKFDEIVEFSEIGKFIDTPSKHYSSGMKVRLGFSVAAHLEPEVMFVDEVLAVGDAAFRKKCTEKVASIAADGTTVLLVSHNAQSVTAICDRAVWLHGGEKVEDGPATDVITRYLSESIGLAGEREFGDDVRSGGEVAKLRAIRVRNSRGDVTNTVDVREAFCVEADIEVFKPGCGLVLKLDMNTSDNMGAFSSIDTNNPTWSNEAWSVGHHTVRMWVPGNFLQLDTYPVGAALWQWSPEREVQFASKDLVCVHVTDSGEGPTSMAGFTTGSFPGPIRPVMEWEMESGGRILTAQDGS